MEFRVHERHIEAGPVQLDGYASPAAHDEYSWELVKADGEVVARGPHPFATEPLCRSQIAQSKKAMKGAMRCKVVTIHASD